MFQTTLIRCSFALSLLAAVSVGPAWGASNPVKVILDSDMITDYDDVGALACLHALADAGECEILATLSCTRANRSVAVLEIINAFYGRPDIPVGCAKGIGVSGGGVGAAAKAKPLDRGEHAKYVRLAKDYPQWVKHLDSNDAPDANEVYRRVLAAQPDHSVVICSIGFLTNLRRLLETKPDAISPLDGRALVEKKVRLWVAMACQYPKGMEYNSRYDAESSAIALEKWPTPIAFTDFEYGKNVYTGRRIAEDPTAKGPVKDIFQRSLPPRSACTETSWDRLAGHPSWDETAVLYAVRGARNVFGTERGTHRMTGTDGSNVWKADPKSRDLRLVEKMPYAQVGEIIDELMCRKSKARQAAEKEEVAALEKLRADIGYGAVFGTYYTRRFGIEGRPRATDAELAKLRDDSIAAYRRLVELRPDDCGYRIGYGEEMLYLGHPAEALPQFRHAIGCAPNDEQWARAMFWTAEAQFALGDRAGTEETLRALVGRNVRTGGRYKTDWTGYGRWVLRWFDGNEPDALGWPHGTRAKPFPQPQEAKYTEKFTALNAVALKLVGVKPDDARVRLLKTKFRRLGILIQDGAPFTVTLALDPAASVAEREGYTLDVTDKDATVRARDPQGILWGVVSLVQCINPEKRCVRQLAVRDWPVGEGRGFLGCFTPEALEYTLFLKMNSVDFQRGCPIANDCLTPLRMYMCEQMAREFNDLGLTMYVDGHWLGEAPDLPACEPRAFEYRVDVCRRFAKIGAGVYWAQDDGRFPLNARDKETYGTAANCDAKHITAVYRAVKKDHPNFKLIYCPPFYWGPDARASYPEDRETYLKSIGDFLDPEIDVYWTGPQVKGLDKKPYQVKWFADLTKRKPSIFQNAICPHFFVDFLVDPIPWDKLHYDGFLKDIRHFHLNCNGYHEIGPLSLQGSWCWNPKGYDAKAESKAAITQAIGDGVYDALAPGLDDLAYFDKYPWGKVNANILYEDPADLEKKYLNAKACWEKACKINPLTARYSWFGGVLNDIPRVVAAAKNPPDMISRYKNETAATRELAILETKCEPEKGDFVFTPMDMNGLQPDTMKIAEDGKTRFVKWMRGAQTRENAVSFAFECDPFPPTGDYKLVICGVEDELPAKTQLKIELNGKPIYEGDTLLPAAKGDLRLKGGGNFGRHEFVIPFASMVRKNTVTVSCASPGYNRNGTPYIGINYIVLRKSR